MTKELTDKAIDIKGKKYVLVSDRVIYFNETYPNWSIVTTRIMTDEGWLEVFKATVTPDCSKPERYFTGYSQARWWEWMVNKTAALENAETSAVWRSLAMMWIWVIDSIASVDEMNKAGAGLGKFTDSVFKKFEENKGMFQTGDEAIDMIKSKYVIDQVREAKVRSLYTK